MKKLIAIFPLLILFLNPVISQNLHIDWQNCFGGTESDEAQDMIQTEGGYLIVGYTKSNDGDVSFNHGGNDFWLVKINNTGTLIWQKSYGGTAGDIAMRILATTGGAFYIAGSSSSSDGDISNDPYPNSPDYWIIKIDSIGGIIWEKIVGGPGGERLENATSTSDGGIIAIGTLLSSGGGDITNFYGMYDMWLIKLDNEGNTDWDFTIGTSWIDSGHAIIQTSDGGYLAGGASRIEDGGNLTCVPFNYKAEAILMKLDSNRNIEWQQCYGGSEDDGAIGLLEVQDGYVFLAYASSGDGDLTGSGWHGATDIWVVRTDFSGNIIWQKCYGGSSYEFASRIFQTNDGGFVVVGHTESLDGDVVGNHSIGNHDDIWMFKINNVGDLIWQKCFGGIADEMIEFGVVKKSDNKYVLAGTANYSPSFDVDCDFNYTGVANSDYWVLRVSDTTVGISINHPELNALKVYPNPAKDYVVFEQQGPQTIHPKQNAVQITNIFGQVIQTLKILGKQTVWDTQQVKPGIYFYKTEGSNYFGKVVISE